jgi:cytosine/adenosine deaminase-related metal-dependent hydrolase
LGRHGLSLTPSLSLNEGEGNLHKDPPLSLAGGEGSAPKDSSLSPTGGEGQGEGAIKDGAVAFRGDTVLAAGPRPDLEARFGPSEHLDAILMPAFVNAHLHLELSHMARKVPGGDGLPAWIGRFVRTRAAVPESDAGPAMEAAAGQLLRFGVAAVGDVTNTLASLGPLARAGIGGSLYHEVFGATPARIDEALSRARAARDAAGPPPAGLRVVTSPHAVYSTHHPTLARLLAEGPSSVHLAEDPAERTLLSQGGGPFGPMLAAMGAVPGDLGRARSAVALAAPSLHLGNLAVHCVDLDREDLALLARSGATVALCPRSNQHISGRLPNLPGLLAAGIPLALGTDSLASCPSLSPLAEVAALRRAFPEVPAARLVALLWNGAAVGAPWVGRLTPGFAPGVIAAPLDGASAEDPFEFLAGEFGEQGRAVSWIGRPVP